MFGRLNLGLGLGGSVGGGVKPDINLLIIGDSIAGRYLTKSQTELEAALGLYFSNVTVNDVAIGGIGSTKYAGDLATIDYLYDNDANAFSTEYTNEETANSVVAADITDGVLNVGINETTVSLNKALWKAAYQELVDAILARYENMQSLVIIPLGRYFGSPISNTRYQDLREAMEEIADATEKVYLGTPIYDVDLADQLHPADAAYTGILAPRLALDVHNASVKSQETVTPIISSASWDGFTVTATASNVSDITVPSGGEDFFRFASDGTLLLPDAVSKGSASTISIDMSNTAIKSVPDFTLYTGYGQMDGLSQTDAEAPSDVLPFAPSTVVAANNDVISQLTDLALHGRPKIAEKTLSTNAVTAFKDLMRLNYSITGGREPDYDGTAFDGAGAVVAADTSTSMLSAAFTASTGLMIGFVVEFPESFTGNTYVACLGNATGGRFDAALLVNASGGLVYSDNEASGDVQLDANVSGKRAVILINYKGTGDADIYYNSATPINFDPDDVYSTRTYLWLFGLNNSGSNDVGYKIGDWFVKKSAHGVGDPSIADIISYWSDKFSITI